MADRGYGSSGSSRGSTPSPRSSKGYLEPLSIQKEPKQYQTSTPRGESTHSRSSGTKSSSGTSNRKSTIKPLSIHNHRDDAYTPRDDIRSDKRQDSRYYPNSFFESGSKG